MDMIFFNQGLLLAFDLAPYALSLLHEYTRMAVHVYTGVHRLDDYLCPTILR